MKKCHVCGSEFTKRRPNSCIKCYFKKRHAEKYKKKLRKCLSCENKLYLGHKFYCIDCKDDIKACHSKHRIYFGRKFYKSKNGYWVCCTARLPWAHRWVWISVKGEIPKGFDIHHIDGDKDNNDISNLQMLTRSEHQLLHWSQGDHDHEMEIRIKTLEEYRKKKY